MGIFSRRNKDDDYVAWFNKGNALLIQKRYEEAIECYDKVIRLNPEDYHAWHNKGESLKELGRDDKAEECFAKAKELDES